MVLRKEDSSTSILLFVYNLYIESTKGKLCLSSLFEIMGKFEKAETVTRMALSRVRVWKPASRKGGGVCIDLGSPTVHSGMERGCAILLKRCACGMHPGGKWHFVHITLSDLTKAELMKAAASWIYTDQRSDLACPYHQTEV